MNTPLSNVPGAARVRGAAVIGADGFVIEAVAHAAAGNPALLVTGLPEASAWPARDRVRAAILNSGVPWPPRHITVSLEPAGTARRGTGLDLAMAVAALAAGGTVPAGSADRSVLVADLGLDGSLRPVRGVLPALLAAADAGCDRAVIATQNGAETAAVPGIQAIPLGSLREVIAWLRGEPGLGPHRSSGAGEAGPSGRLPGSLSSFAPIVVLALEAAAAGGHHLCLTGPHGAGIPMLAETAAALLPPLDPAEALEVSAIHSAAGLLGASQPLVTRPPLRAPHHTLTRAAMAGGGAGVIRPGEAALAHRGILFLRDAPEFDRDVLAVLREPLTSQAVTVSRAGQVTRFPARLILITGMRPCPCPPATACTCTMLYRRRYRARVMDLLGSYLPIHVTLDPPSPRAASVSGSAGRVAQARDRARRRLRGTPWTLNSEVPGSVLRKSFPMPAEAAAVLRRAVDLREISLRSAAQVTAVAWTLADLDSRDRPDARDAGQALAFWLGGAR